MSNSKVIRSPKSGKYGLQEVGDEKDVKLKKIQGILNKVLSKYALEVSEKDIEKISRKILATVEEGA